MKKMGNYKVCCCFTRNFKVTESGPPSDVKDMFKLYSGDGIHMTPDHFRRFLNDEVGHGQAVSISEADRIVDQILHKRHHLVKLINRKSLNLDDFFHFLFNTDLNPPIRSQVFFILFKFKFYFF